MSEINIKQTPPEVYLKYALFERLEKIVSLIGLKITDIKPHQTIPSQLHLTKLLPDGKMELLEQQEIHKDPSFLEPDIVASGIEDNEEEIIHGEVQNSLDDMLQRMFFYYSAVQGYNYFNQKIRQILIDTREDSSHFNNSYSDRALSYSYSSLKLIDYKCEEWLESRDPVLMTLYLLTKLESKQTALLSYIEKIKCLKLSGQMSSFVEHLFFAVMRVRKSLKAIYINEGLSMRSTFNPEEDDFYKLGEERGLKLGEERGEERGLKLGEERERRRAKEDFARKLLNNKVDVKTISEYTDLSEDEILTLKR